MLTHKDYRFRYHIAAIGCSSCDLISYFFLSGGGTDAAQEYIDLIIIKSTLYTIVCSLYDSARNGTDFHVNVRLTICPFVCHDSTSA